MFCAYPQGEIQLTALHRPCLPPSCSAPSVGSTLGLTYTNASPTLGLRRGNMFLDFAQHRESQLPYNSEEHWMSLLFLISSLWSQPPSAASKSSMVDVSAGANFQCRVLLCPAASCSTVPNIYRTGAAWQKHTTLQLRVIISSPSMAVTLFIA